MARDKSTLLSKLLQHIRIECDETLCDMSRKLEMSVSYLSMIENGVRQVPDNFVFSLELAYKLSEEQCSLLQQAISKDKDENNGLSNILANESTAVAAFGG